MDELIVITVADLKHLLREVLSQELHKSVLNSPVEEILTSDDVVKLLKISKPFLITLRKKGLPYYPLGYGSAALRYKRSEIMAYMATLKK
jgi:hypothetical protein